MHKAICVSTAKGVPYVVAAGNEGADFRGDVPATYKEVLTVTAMADFDGRPGQAAAPTCADEYDDAYATFSNYAVLASDQSHTVAAPGVCIRSTYKGSAYATLSGTSMATPHVAGTVALCIYAGPCSGTPGQIIARIRADASAYNQAQFSYGFVGDPIEPLSGRYYGYLVRAGVY
jgi:subtilisin family serine protease